MKIAITGGNGFLAGYLIDELLAAGHEVIPLCRKKGSKKDINYIITDYSYESLTGIFRHGIQGIVHLASTRVVASDMDYYEPLIDLTERIYQVAADCQICNIVYTSSISVYSGKDLPYLEGGTPVPKDMYGFYKLTCEQIGERFNDLRKMNIKNLRLAHLYGANEKNNYMINLFFRQAYAHQQLIVQCESHARREMLYAKDAARAIRLALEQEKLPPVLNIGSNDVLTNQEIATIICEVMSPELSIVVENRKETICSSYMCNDKARDILGFSAAYNLASATEEIMSDMRV